MESSGSAAWADAVSADQVSVPDTAAEAEWPPREWREGRRGGGAKGAYRVAGLILLIMIVLVVLSFWGMKNG